MKKISKINKLKKFVFICNNENELKSIQDYLFPLGFMWEMNKHKYIETLWKYPLVIKNFRYADLFGSKYLIIDEKRCYDIMKDKNFEYSKKLFSSFYISDYEKIQIFARQFLLNNKINKIKNGIGR